MIKTDLLRFFIIYFIIVGTSGVVFFYQYKGLGIFAFNTGLGTFMSLFQMSLGEFDYETIQQARYPPLSVILFIVYMMLVHLLLLNMLIAMMTRTYESIAKKTKKEWRRQWASIVIIMERSYNPEELLYFQDLYSTQMGAVRVTSSGYDTDLEGHSKSNPDKQEEIENRGLLWIHDRGVSSGKRKAAITGLWKKSGKEALESQNMNSGKEENR